MTTQSDIMRKQSARMFKLLSDRFPATLVFDGISVTGHLETRSGAPIPSKAGIEDGFAGIAKLPWYAWDGLYFTEPFAAYDLEDFAQGRITVDGVELHVVNASIDANRTVLTLKLGGRFDG